MRKILRLIAERIDERRPSVLATITASSGATPRGAGSRMLVGEEGLICGTIGGGNVEYRSIAMAKEVLESRKNSEHTFKLNRSDVENLGMICGGNVEVSFRYIAPDDEYVKAQCEKAEELFALNRCVWICEGETISISEAEPSGEGYKEKINSPGLVYIFGGGHVAQALVPVLASVNFKCVVMDDRDEFTKKELFPQALRVDRIDFTKALDYAQIGKDDYVCIMTRGHAFDMVLEAQVLGTPAYYIGVIGSASKKAGVNRRLVEEFGIKEEQLERIVSPIGIKIKGETPAEIAISIAAQLIDYRGNKNK